MVLFTLAVTLLQPISAHAADLTPAQETRIEKALDASAVQLALPWACEGLRQEKDFTFRVLEHVKNGAGPVTQALIVSGTGAVAAGSGAFAGYSVNMETGMKAIAVNRHANLKTFQFFKKRADKSLKASGILAAAGALSSAAGSVSSNNEAPNVSVILNQGKLEEFSRETARETAQVFSLNADEQATLQSAIRAEVQKKFNARNAHPLDYFEIMRKANFQGKPILSKEKAEILKKMRAANSEQATETHLTGSEKLSALLVANSALDLCLESNSVPPAEAKEMRAVVSRNRELISEINEAAKVKQAPGEPAPAGEHSLDMQDI